jgi:UDP-3-O-[3-hydroxymyristoyl] glucosamine N-acyltransferase
VPSFQGLKPDTITKLLGTTGSRALTRVIRAHTDRFVIPVPLAYNIGMPQNLYSLAEYLSARVIGDGEIAVSGVASIAGARPGQLVFVESEKHLPEALVCEASAIIAGEFAAHTSSTKPLLIAVHPRLAFATAASLLYAKPERQAGVHPAAVVDLSSNVSPSATIDAYAVIERGAVIGQRTWIGSGCHIGEGVTIGDDCEIYPRVVIYGGTTLGRRVIVHAGAVLGSDGFGFVRDETYGRYIKFPQVGQLVIGDYVEIGANCTIDRGALDQTVIGPGTKLDNMVHIGHNCAIGANVVMAAQTGLSGSVTVGDNCLLGGQVGIGDHATLEPGIVLGGQGGILPYKVMRNKGAVLWGTPARPLREYLKELAALARLAKSKY